MNSKCPVKNRLPTYTYQTNIIIKEEEKFLINMFVENGHNKQLWKNIVVEYNNKTNNKNNRENNTQNGDILI